MKYVRIKVSVLVPVVDGRNADESGETIAKLYGEEGEQIDPHYVVDAEYVGTETH